VKHKLATILFLVVALVVATFSVSTNLTTPAAKAAPPNDPDTPGTPWPIDDPRYRPSDSDNVILKWNEELLQAIRLHPPQTGPTITARAIGVLHTATYDAWAAYDAVAKGTRLGSQLRRPAAERTEANKKKAISFAAYRVLTDLFPAARHPRIGEVDFAGQMTELGYTPNNSTNRTKPDGIGNVAAQAVLDYRHKDGSNQSGGYADTTNYQPVNTWNQINNPWRWQPLCVLTAAGVAAGRPHLPPAGEDCVAPHYTQQPAYTPQFKNVVKFAQFNYSIPGPKKDPNGQYSKTEIDELLQQTADLTDREKVTAEYWADGPNTEFPPGHTCVFAQVISRKRGHSLDHDVKMFFEIGNALMDAAIASWNSKYVWDFVRPATAIRYHYAGKQVRSWLGPYQGYGTVDGSQWRPYQAPNVVTPPFPEYTSGHSTFTAAGAHIVAQFTGTDSFGASVTIKAGSSLFEPRTATHPGVPAQDVTLSWPTFTLASEEAAMSRIYGGIHFRSGNEHGRMMGRQVGINVHARAQLYIRGMTPG
jgi:PAP2 superfamily